MAFSLPFLPAGSLPNSSHAPPFKLIVSFPLIIIIIFFLGWNICKALTYLHWAGFWRSSTFGRMVRVRLSDFQSKGLLSATQCRPLSWEEVKGVREVNVHQDTTLAEHLLDWHCFGWAEPRAPQFHALQFKETEVSLNAQGASRCWSWSRWRATTC